MALNAFCSRYAECLPSDAIRRHVATAMVSAYNNLSLPILEVITYKCLFIFQKLVARRSRSRRSRPRLWMLSTHDEQSDAMYQWNARNSQKQVLNRKVGRAFGDDFQLPKKRKKVLTLCSTVCNWRLMYRFKAIHAKRELTAYRDFLT